MPIECDLLKPAPYALEECPKCGETFPEFMRGIVQRPKRFLWIFWKRDYCAVICHGCKEIIGYESPPKQMKRYECYDDGEIKELMLLDDPICSKHHF